MTKRHAIFAATDGGRASFLLDHWLVSLQQNVDLTHIDVNVLDYGLTAAHRSRLEAQGVICHACVKNGQVGDIRLRDMAAIARRRNYDQLLSVDAGDLIFQADISGLFEQDKDCFRAVCEERRVPIHHAFMDLSDVPRGVRRRVLGFLYDKPVINCGFVLGPVAKFQLLWQTFAELGIGHQCYCTDQLVANYLLYRDGFCALPSGYNFVVASMRAPFSIRQGVFHDAAGKVIPVVHNAGMKQFTRRIANFGYGPAYNQKGSWLALAATRYLIYVGNWWKRLVYGVPLLAGRREVWTSHALHPHYHGARIASTTLNSPRRHGEHGEQDK